MTTAELNEIIEESFDRIRELRATKGADYAHSDDAFDNFKRHAATLGLTPEQIWAVYAAKHWDAVMSYCKRGQIESEPIESRIDDLLVYLLLLKGQVFDRKREAEEKAAVANRLDDAMDTAAGLRVIPIRRVELEPEGSGDAA